MESRILRVLGGLLFNLVRAKATDGEGNGWVRLGLGPLLLKLVC
jgi:hypothetical protein